MKNIFILFLLITFWSIAMSNDHKTVYEFSFSQKGKDLKLSDFKGKVLLIVNTASNCGFTKQYEGLEHLYTKYEKQGLIIIAVPSNDFGGQEPGTNEEIVEFCKLNYGVTLPVVDKQIVSGDDAHPFYLWARKELGFGTAPKWNFHKYLIDRNGNLVDYFYSTTTPEDSGLVSAIERLLN